MPRTYVRKTARGLHSDVAMREALLAVKKGMKFFTAAKMYGVDRTTLRRYCKKFENVDVIPDDTPLTSNYVSSCVFTEDQEMGLEEYLLILSNIGHGLTAAQLKSRAYEYASANSIAMPKTWTERNIAGQEWYLKFLKRHPILSERMVEPSSTSAFNRINIQNYFIKLEGVIQRHACFINGSRKWNLDETATSTVGTFQEKVITPRGQKQVHQVKGHERGTSVTTVCFISAPGQTIPPAMIFPRVNFVKHMLVGAYPGTLGLANKAGYMTQEAFLPVIQHFIYHTKSSKEDPTLLIVDNVSTHLSLECINLCRDNGVTLFTLPPHTTHRTQPLDVGLFGPFKTAYDKVLRAWTAENPGIPPSIYNVAEFVGKAWSKSATPANIISAFKATGIHPFNKEIFVEKDFMPSLVTHVDVADLPEHQEGNQVPEADLPEHQEGNQVPEADLPEQHESNQVPEAASPSTNEHSSDKVSTSTPKPHRYRPFNSSGFPRRSPKKPAIA